MHARTCGSMWLYGNTFLPTRGVTSMQMTVIPQLRHVGVECDGCTCVSTYAFADQPPHDITRIHSLPMHCQS
jgi:hypothetical protein